MKRNTRDPKQVDRSIFDGSTEKNEFKVYLEQNQILTQTKRIKIAELNFNSLRFDHQYKKYAKVKFNDNGHETKDLKTFLIELQDSIKEHSEYFYQTDLPYGTREEEGNKIRIFLKDKNILKSGGLAIHNYGNKQEEIDKLSDEILEDSGYENDKKLIQSKLSVLQGDIRSYKGGLKATLTDFIDLPDQEIVPTELNFFQGLALNKFLIIKEDKSWWDWNAFAVAMIGLAQVIAGAVLISFGAVNIGGALVAEGISDMVYETMAGLSGYTSVHNLFTLVNNTNDLVPTIDQLISTPTAEENVILPSKIIIPYNNDNPSITMSATINENNVLNEPLSLQNSLRSQKGIERYQNNNDQSTMNRIAKELDKTSQRLHEVQDIPFGKDEGG
ncbi:unnamed protein product [Didymodactylos carnosus]|uniref:Uncharacterized protein n=1 Tax=Didymodactylos carnosus TaxID=1234261 RepID=A0A814AEW5_9BILA|nr:unnamed protein product [Didymodactylos carnosus]CAF3694411.1 unnamed protein product [Didymodactylos carnosus]